MTTSSGKVVSKSQYKGSNAPSLRNLTMDEEKMKTGHWLGVSTFEFPLVLWHSWLGDRKGTPPHKNVCQLSPKIPIWNKWKKFTEGNRISEHHMENIR